MNISLNVPLRYMPYIFIKNHIRRNAKRPFTMLIWIVWRHWAFYNRLNTLLILCLWANWVLWNCLLLKYLPWLRTYASLPYELKIYTQPTCQWYFESLFVSKCYIGTVRLVTGYRVLTVILNAPYLLFLINDKFGILYWIHIFGLFFGLSHDFRTV